MLLSMFADESHLSIAGEAILDGTTYSLQVVSSVDVADDHLIHIKCINGIGSSLFRREGFHKMGPIIHESTQIYILQLLRIWYFSVSETLKCMFLEIGMHLSTECPCNYDPYPPQICLRFHPIAG